MWASLKNEFNVNRVYLHSMGLEQQTLLFLAALLCTPFSVLLYWLREGQFEASFRLYKLYMLLVAANEYRPRQGERTWGGVLKDFFGSLLAIIPFSFLLLLNGSSFAQHYARLNRGFYSAFAFCATVLLMPLWLILQYSEPLVYYLGGLIGFGALFEFTTFLLLLAFGLFSFVPAMLVPIFRVDTQSRLVNISYFLLAGLAVYFTLSFSMLWAFVVAWYLFEPLFIMHKPFNTNPISFKDDSWFNEQAIVEVFFHQKMLQLKDYWVLESEVMLPLVEKLFIRFWDQETDPELRIRFLHHFLVEAKLHRRLTQAEYACILRHVGINLGTQETLLEDAFRNFQFHQTLKDFVAQQSTVVCQASHTVDYGNATRTFTWTKQAQHKNPYATYLEECQALLKDISPLNVQVSQQQGGQDPILNALLQRFNTKEAMTDGVREGLNQVVEQARRQHYSY